MTVFKPMQTLLNRYILKEKVDTLDLFLVYKEYFC